MDITVTISIRDGEVDSEHTCTYYKVAGTDELAGAMSETLVSMHVQPETIAKIVETWYDHDQNPVWNDEVFSNFKLIVDECREFIKYIEGKREHLV